MVIPWFKKKNLKPPKFSPKITIKTKCTECTIDRVKLEN